MLESIAISALLGAVLASFAISLSECRLSSLFRFSVCDNCGQPLSVKQLAPIFSSFLKIACRCGYIPSLRYGALEAFLAIAFSINTFVFGPTFFSVLMNAFTFISFYISLLDWKTFQIPLSSLCFLAILGCVWSYLQADTLIAFFVTIIGTLSFYLFWKFLRKTKPMGGGDVLLFAFSGLWLSLDLIPVFLFVAGAGGVLTPRFFKGTNARFPFTPAILFALWVSILGSFARY
jgi:prepilin signal peptidase PulO-like enzyme (type II secretory pathway)